MSAIRRLLFRMMSSLVNDWLQPHLVRGVIAFATVLALLTGTTARADDPLLLATGGVYGGMTQNYAVCYVFNVGKIPAHVTMIIRDETGGSAGPFTTTVVLPGRISAVANYVANNLSYSCTITGSPKTANLRAVMDFRDVYDNVLISSDLR
jgi:hypothetical protein